MRVLRRRELNDRLRRDGFVVVKGIDRGYAVDLGERWLAGRDVRDTFDPGLPTWSPDQKRQAHEMVATGLKPIVEGQLTGHRPLIGTFAVKGTGGDSAMRVHQDWSVVDERNWLSVNVWCPLMDVGTQNGTIEFLPGSHMLTSQRGSAIPHSCRDIMDLEDHHFVPMRLSAGEAVVYYHSTVHRSVANCSGSVRIAAMLGLYPGGARPVHFHQAASGSIQVYAADTDFYIRFGFNEADVPDDTALLGSTLPFTREVTIDSWNQVARHRSRTDARGNVRRTSRPPRSSGR